MSKVAVSGAGGWLGRSICERLSASGHTVIALDRLGTPQGPWLRFVPFELESEASADQTWCGALTGSVAFIHCAGHAHRPVETRAEIARFFQINAEGTRRVVAACRSSGVSRFVYLSTVALYDWSHGCVAQEDSPLLASTAYAKSKLEGEEAVSASGLDWSIVRLATVFGSRDRANFAKLAKALRDRRFILPGAGTARKSVVPVDLAAALIVELALRSNVRYRLLNIGLPESPTLAEIVDGFVRVCGFRQPRRMPFGLLRLLAFAGDFAANVRPSFPLTTCNLRKLSTGTQVDVQRMLSVFPGRSWPTFAGALARHKEWYYREPMTRLVD